MNITQNSSFRCGVVWKFFLFPFFPSVLLMALLALLSVSGVSYMPCVQAGALGQQGVQPGPWGQQGFQPACGSRVSVGLGLAPEFQGLRCVQGLSKLLTL